MKGDFSLWNPRSGFPAKKIGIRHTVYSEAIKETGILHLRTLKHLHGKKKNYSQSSGTNNTLVKIFKTNMTYKRLISPKRQSINQNREFSEKDKIQMIWKI